MVFTNDLMYVTAFLRPEDCSDYRRQEPGAGKFKIIAQDQDILIEQSHNRQLYISGSKIAILPSPIWGCYPIMVKDGWFILLMLLSGSKSAVFNSTTLIGHHIFSLLSVKEKFCGPYETMAIHFYL